jgi:hypothetical protein
MDRESVVLIAVAAIITTPVVADDSVFSFGIGRDRAYAAGISQGEQTTTSASVGFGSSAGLGLEFGYLDLGDIQRTIPGTFGAHAWTAGVSYSVNMSRRFDAILGIGSYWSGSSQGADHHGYWDVGARYWISRNIALSTRYRQLNALLGERHKVSTLSLDIAF